MINQDGSGHHGPTPSNAPPYAPPPGAAPPNYGAPPPYPNAPYPGHYPPQKGNKGLVIALASALGAIVLIGIVVLVIWLSGGFGSRSSSTAPTSAASRETAWLYGVYWKKSCTADEAIAFDSAGQVTIYERGNEHVGSYTLTGNSLSMTVEGRTATMQARPSGRSMLVSGSSGPPNGTYLRCSSPARNGAPVS